MEPIKGRVFARARIFRETAQNLKEWDVVLPDAKPDIASVLSANGSVFIDRAEPAGERVSYKGSVKLSLLYLARGAAKNVGCVEITEDIDDLINLDCDASGAEIEVRAEIENIDCKIINDRKIGVRVILSVTGEGTRGDSREIITGIDGAPENQLQKTPLKLSKVVAAKKENFTVKDELTLPGGKQGLAELLTARFAVGNKEIKAQNGRVSISGELVLTCLYLGAEDGRAEFFESEIPFSGQIEAEGASEDMFVDGSLSVAESYIQIRQDADGEDRALGVESTVRVQITVSAREDIEILTDAYCINRRVRLERSPVVYEKLICRNRSQTPVKEIITIGGNCPEMLQILCAEGRAVVDEVKVLEDKVSAEGAIFCDLLYVASSDEAPLYSYKCEVPFKHFIETKGASYGCEVSLSASVEHCAFNMLSGKEVELRFLLCFNTVVYRTVEDLCVTEAVFEEIDPQELNNMPSMVIYAAEEGDTLFKIAKEYNTSVDEILSVNELEPSAEVNPGQKFLLVKKVEC
ncbi:MAG: DUF3794 domain-containing protein [Clostridiales bacterium]|jgi:hypothetical protein|nr:DUF3794 domain-containing protein [Clostridiales bacterium]